MILPADYGAYEMLSNHDDDHHAPFTCTLRCLPGHQSAETSSLKSIHIYSDTMASHLPLPHIHYRRILEARYLVLSESSSAVVQ